MKRVFRMLMVLAALAPAAARAQIVVDGTRDAGYGSALAVQTVETGFGDANPAGGSELDAGYARLDGGRLYLLLTGNLEANFNKLEIFIDSKAGGQSVFDSSGNDGAGAMDTQDSVREARRHGSPPTPVGSTPSAGTARGAT